jgi:uncharacterized membrane protein
MSPRLPRLSEVEKRFVQSMAVLSGLCFFLLVARTLISGSGRYWFIPGNLILAWLGLVFGWFLVRQLATKRWASWQNVSLTILWLVFLPNTWYVLTDFLHVYTNGEISQIYDVVLITSLVVCGFILGFTSLYLVHQEFRKRLGDMQSGILITTIILASSFAIYLGRDLRWNTWDVIANPSGIILNVSDRIIDPLGHPRALNVTLLFFLLLSGMYLAIWLFFRPKPKS